MKIEFVGNRISFGLKRKIKRSAELTLDNLGQNHKNMLLSIEFMSASDMQELNNRTRGINSATDVLSYPNFNIKPHELIDPLDQANYIGKYILLGDMAICLSRAEEQAKEYKHDLDDEIIKLVIHSVLHLMGFDHIEDEDFEVMNREEEKISSKFYKKIKV